MLGAVAKKRLAFLVAAVFTFGCSKDHLLPSKSDESSEQNDDREDTKADEPVQVTGTFLTIHCDADGFSVEKDSSIGTDPVVSCLIKNDDGSRYDKAISGVNSEVFFEDGSPISAETQISENPPWHFYIKMSEEDRKKVAKGNFKIDSPENSGVIHSEEFDYKWFEDPLFALLVIGLKAQPDVERVTKSIAKTQAWAGDSHTIFASDKIFSGGFGVGAADSYCDSEGKKLIPERTWVGLLSTSKQTAREKITLNKPVFNVFGDGISYKSPDKEAVDNFWSNVHPSSLRMTQTGKQTNLFDEVDGRLRVIDLVWSGTTPDGAFDSEFGSCSDWSSDSADLTASVGDTQINEDARWIRSRKVKCASKARILCISL